MKRQAAMKRKAASRPAAITLLLAALIATMGLSALVVANATADTPQLTVQTHDQINTTDSDQIQVGVQHATPSDTYSVLLKVSLTTSPPGMGGGPFCGTFDVSTDSGGNGQTMVSFPDDPGFSNCSTTQTGGPNTEVPGTYTVTASTTFTTTVTATTTFLVQEPQHEISGSGLYIPSTSSSSNFWYPSTSSSRGTCAFNAAQTTTGSVGFSGIITSNTPGQKLFYVTFSGCTTPQTGGAVGINTDEFFGKITLPSVTVSCTAPTTTIPTMTSPTPPYTFICPQGGYSKTGSLTITLQETASISSPSALSNGVPVFGGQLAIVGGGGLRGLTGTGTILNLNGASGETYTVDLHVP